MARGGHQNSPPDSAPRDTHSPAGPTQDNLVRWTDEGITDLDVPSREAKLSKLGTQFFPTDADSGGQVADKSGMTVLLDKFGAPPTLHPS